MNPLRQQMPALLRHEGVWHGTYRLIDRGDRLLDTHRSEIEVRFPESGPYHYVQRNRFVWPDGRERRAEHPGVCRDGALHWDTQEIVGQAWQVDTNSIVLHWRRHDAPDALLYELIVLAPDSHHRSRTWHWLRGGELFQRTLIDELRVVP
jgi:hypothetical protein